MSANTLIATPLQGQRRGHPNDAYKLRITEIFYSLQGESRSVGIPTVFIRLTGCPLRCSYCDTEYAFTGGTLMTQDAILTKISSYKANHVCVTGGEPLAQKNCFLLLETLCNNGFEVSLETSGAIDISDVDSRVCRVIDLKTPGSGEVGRNRLENLDKLNNRDQIKFVIVDRQDFDWARAMLDKHHLTERCEVLFSPAHGRLEPAQLADWILTESLAVRFQIQLHKLLWGERAGV